MCKRVVVVEGLGGLVETLRGWPGGYVAFTIVVNGYVWLVKRGFEPALVDAVELIHDDHERLVESNWCYVALKVKDGSGRRGKKVFDGLLAKLDRLVSVSLELLSLDGGW